MNDHPESAVSDPVVSVIVAISTPDYGQVDCQLVQLEHQETRHEYEVLLADNSGGLVGTGPRGRYQIVQADQQPGAAHARNQAAGLAAGRFLLFCDADDLVGPGWIDAHLSALEVHRFTAGSFRSVFDTDRCWIEALRGAWPVEGFSETIRKHEGIKFATSANCGIEASLFNLVGGFPIDYRRSQDVAMSLAARRFGAELRFVAEAQVLKQVGHRSTKQEWLVNLRAGGSRVRLRRDFAVGPSPMTLATRSVGRLGRALYRWVKSVGAAPVKETAQLAGILSELLIGGFRSSRA
jgi:GT2 family glycosyltransferase